MLQETGVHNAKPADSPLETGVKLAPDVGQPLEDQGKYRRLVDQLIYLTVTRPNLSFAVSVASHFMQSPKVPHWNAMMRIL